MKKRIWIIILAILVLWGGYLRFESLGKQSLWMDEGYSIATATGILEHGYPLLDSGITSWRAFPAHYIMSAGLYLFDDPQVGGRVFTALAGTLLIFVFYLFNLQIFKSRRQALIAIALMAFMTYEIAWSRQARMYVFLQLFMVTALYFYYRFIEGGKALSLILMTVFALLSILTHQAGYLVALILLLTTLFDIKKFRPYLEWIKSNKILSAGLLVILGLIAYLLISVKGGSSLISAINNIKSDVGMDYSFNYVMTLFMQFGLFFFVAIIGFFILNWQEKRKYILAISIGVVAYFLMISFQNTLFHYRYTLPIVPFILMFIAYPIDRIFACPERSRGKKLKKRHIGVSVIAGIVVLALMYFGEFNFLPAKYILGRTAPQPDWKAGYEWIKKDAKEQDISTISILPMFHDIYIGKDRGDKYFIPYSVSGYPGDIKKKSGYAEAVTLETLSQFLGTKGYVILDDYGYRMLENEDIKNYLQALPPVKTLKNSGYDLMIWKL